MVILKIEKVYNFCNISHSLSSSLAALEQKINFVLQWNFIHECKQTLEKVFPRFLSSIGTFLHFNIFQNFFRDGNWRW